MEPRTNLDLKVAILKAEMTQRQVARKARIHETRFSAIVRGRINPSQKEQDRIARALATNAADLFGGPAESEGVIAS